MQALPCESYHARATEHIQIQESHRTIYLWQIHIDTGETFLKNIQQYYEVEFHYYLDLYPLSNGKSGAC